MPETASAASVLLQVGLFGVAALGMRIVVGRLVCVDLVLHQRRRRVVIWNRLAPPLFVVFGAITALGAVMALAPR